MKISEVNDVLKKLFQDEGNVNILGISVIKNQVSVCFEDKEKDIKVMKVDYKNCDL